jgi:hypothetical protein
VSREVETMLGILIKSKWVWELLTLHFLSSKYSVVTVISTSVVIILSLRSWFTLTLQTLILDFYNFIKFNVINLVDINFQIHILRV